VLELAKKSGRKGKDAIIYAVSQPILYMRHMYFHIRIQMAAACLERYHPQEERCN
jgi:hypothetical protein